jgi:hypothetical protein
LTIVQDQPAGGAWEGELAMLRRTWYRHLARINRLIADARQRIDIQKMLICQLEHKKRSTIRAFARLRRFEVELHSLMDHREIILVKVRRFPLPAELCGANPHFEAYTGARPTPIQRFLAQELPAAS